MYLKIFLPLLKNKCTMYSFTAENYLKAIYKLEEAGNRDITTNDIAAKVNTAAATVTDMLKKLSRKKLLRYKKYNGVRLTESGRKAALHVIRKHRLWEMFIAKTLRFKWDEVHEVAEQLEHIHSEKLIRRIDQFLKYPKFDPHGDPIPDTNGNFISGRKSMPLSDLLPGKTIVMTGVADHSIGFLQLLDKSGIVLGCKLKIKAVQPYDKSLSILLNGKKKLFISSQIAKNILVAKK